MAGRAVVAGIALAALAGFGPAAASDFDRYEPEDRFGGWIVLCDSEDDMASITYFDCVVQSDTLPAIVVSSLGDAPQVSLAEAASSGRLTLADRSIVFGDCPDGVCPLATAGDDLGSVLTGGTVEVEGQTAALSADGLSDALDLALRLPE